MFVNSYQAAHKFPSIFPSEVRFDVLWGQQPLAHTSDLSAKLIKIIE